MLACFARWLGSDVMGQLPKPAAPEVANDRPARAMPRSPGCMPRPGVVLVSSWLLCFVCSRSTHAQPAEPGAELEVVQDADAAPALLRVAVLRAAEGEPGALAGSIDGAMLRSLSDLAGIESPTVSPVDYSEIRLTVGCSDEGSACLASIAQMLEVDAVVVRRLRVEPKRVTLGLLHFDARSQDEPALAETAAEPAQADRALVAAVPSLVRAVFRIPEPVAPAPAREVEASEAQASTPSRALGRRAEVRNQVSVLTWITLAAGTGVLVAGLAMGASADSQFQRFEALDIQSRADAERADALFDSTEARALIANVLMPGGAVVMAVGAALLVLDLTEESAPAALAVQPVPGGALLSLRATSEAF
jgi:hypothetical protein